MNRACFKNATELASSTQLNLHEQKIYKSCIRPIKNNFVRMKRNRQYVIVGFIVLCLFTEYKINAQIVLPKVIGHNMVLQRNKPVYIWGYASVGEHITVKFDKQIKETIADSAKNWKVVLDPMEASDNPAEMVISGSNTIKLENILVGEVWFCSGQSNMEYSMRKDSKASATINKDKPFQNELEVAKNPNIRIFLVNRKFMSPDSTHRGWNIARDSALRPFSAVGYYFSKELNKELHVPIGIISSAIPGSRIEPWISSKVFTTSPYFTKNDSLKKSGEPGKFYPNMVQPVSPFSMRGFLWYQGESNCFLNDTILYTYKMQLLINSWRKAWLDQSLSFYFVQIAPFRYSRSIGKIVLTEESLPKFREAQSLALQLPNTGMAVITDLVDSLDGIHPPYKSEVGRRLSLWALSKDYGKNVVFSGPMYKQMKIVGNKIELEFNYCGSGLVSHNGKPLDWFTIAGIDGKFVPAKAIIKGSKVIVSSIKISSPIAVRFAWNEAAQPNLFNKDGLPAVPFRTDNPSFILSQP
jgi:sialate O-acetylesterase